MRYFTSILILVLATASLGQTKDRRAALDIDGRVKEISVSPDEKIWLVTAIGNTYFTNNIDSNWHFGMALTASGDHSSLNNPNLERISFFNKDTAIMTGYISAYEKDYTKNGYYFTTDAGKNWRLLDYGGNSWIYTIHTDKYGNAWMGGVHKELYYSSNFGQSWTTLKLPYKSSDRTYGIYMSNSKSGIASSDRNEIIRTEDNWNTASKIQTPLDQEKYQPNESMGYNDNRISKVILWNNFMVVNQDGNIFYSDVDIVNWKSFPIKIVDFEVDIDSKKLFAVSDSFKIILFSSPTDFQTLSSKRLSNRPIDIKVVNKSLFVISHRYEVYKVNVQEFTHSIPYTNDIEIPDPRIIKRFSTLTWGIDKNQIYLSEDSRNDWYREKALDFSVADFKLQSDSLAILWDGIKNNYLYSLKDHKPLIYYPVDPLKSFLTSRIKSFSINSGSQGCFHSLKSEVKYVRINDSTFATSNVSQKQFKDKQVSTFNNEISGTILANTLATINSNPSAIPLLQDFQISAKDKKNYLDLVDEQLKSNKLNYSGKKVINKVFYYSVPSMLDTLSSSIVGRVMNQGEAWYSTTSNWFNIQIINQNNDTLNITRNYYVSIFPWNLPWKFKYKGQYFNSCNIELSKFINACIPDDFLDKEIFDNKLLIMQIADYLYNRP